MHSFAEKCYTIALRLLFNIMRNTRTTLKILNILFQIPFPVFLKNIANSYLWFVSPSAISIPLNGIKVVSGISPVRVTIKNSTLLGNDLWRLHSVWTECKRVCKVRGNNSKKIEDNSNLTRYLHRINEKTYSTWHSVNKTSI